MGGIGSVSGNIGAELTGATGRLLRYFKKYRGKHIFMPRYFVVNNLLAIGDWSQLSPPIFTCCSLLFGN